MKAWVQRKGDFWVQKDCDCNAEKSLYRAVYIARSLGMEAYGVAADLRPYATKKSGIA